MTLRVLGVVIAVAVVVLAWPRALGGSTSYVVVSGVSMEPTYETGDLVVARAADDYEVGDVIAFATADGPVIHRAVGGDPTTGFTTQGDNVHRVDPYRPTTDEILGRAVVHLPAVGGLGLRVVQTVPAPVLVALAAVLAFGGGGRRRRGRRAAPAEGAPAPRSDAPLRRPRVAAAAACVVAAVVVLPSAVLAWAAPLDGTAPLVAVALPTSTVRWLALGLLVALSGAAALLVRAEVRDAPELLVRMRHASLLVELAPDADVGGDLVRVASIDELARLARRDGGWILHRARPDGGHQYVVPGPGPTYEVVLDGSAAPSGSMRHGADVVAPAAGDLDLAIGPTDGDASDTVPTAPGDLSSARVVVVEDLHELTQLSRRDGAPSGRIHRRRLGDGTIRYSIVRDGRVFVHVRRPAGGVASKQPAAAAMSGRGDA